jgi:hypothetical protein
MERCLLCRKNVPVANKTVHLVKCERMLNTSDANRVLIAESFEFPNAQQNLTETTWNCPFCTYCNLGESNTCEMCQNSYHENLNESEVPVLLKNNSVTNDRYTSIRSNDRYTSMQRNNNFNRIQRNRGDLFLFDEENFEGNNVIQFQYINGQHNRFESYESANYEQLLELFPAPNNPVSDVAISNFPVHVFRKKIFQQDVDLKSASSIDDAIDSCAICLDSFKEGDKVKSLPCFHSFHDNCIDKWLRQASLCPVCKFYLK